MAVCFGAAVAAAAQVKPSTYAAPKKKLSPKELARTIVRRRPMEEIYAIRVERSAGKKRLEELGVENWSKWSSGECSYLWDWVVDEWVYVVNGKVQVKPADSELFAEYSAGDLVRFPKWFDATLTFKGEYEQKYKFVAYGDNELD